MRAAVATLGALVVLGAAPAVAQPRAAKALPDKVAAAAGDAFSAAVAADEAGDLRQAVAMYQRAFAIAPHPSALYNLGDVQRRLGLLTDAVRSYEGYLLLAPGAPDRADIEALIARLRRAPGTLRLQTIASVDRQVDFAASYVLVDGEIVRTPGAQPAPTTGPIGGPMISLDLLGGEHRIDIVSALTYVRAECTVRAGERTECTVTGPLRVDGNVVLSGDDRIDVMTRTDERGRPDGGINERVTLPPGKTKLGVKDRSYECRPLVIDAPATEDKIAYAYLGTTEWDRLERCRTLAVKQHLLTFKLP